MIAGWLEFTDEFL